MVNTSFTLGSLTSVLFSIIFLAGVGSFSPALVPLRQNPLYICLFILFAIVMTMTILMSNVFVAQRHAKYTMIVNLISCTLQLVMILLLMPFTHSFSGIVAVFAFSGAIALIFGTIFLLPRTLKEYRPVPVINIGIVKEIIHFSFTNYVANMLWSFAIYLLPIMVVNLLNKESNAYFYIAWTMGAVLSTIAGATTNALFAEGSFDENQLGTNVWRCLKMTYFLLIPAALIVFLLADKLLLIYGTDYSSKGRLLLRLMCITALPLSMNSIYISILRVQKRTTLLILLSLVVAAITLITSYLLLPHLGITATGIGWLVSQSVVAIFVGCRLLKLRKTGQI
jgi:O-antigen/teichoic acid export membrane protein